ncbi:MAG: hypothetical protein J6N22_05250 [Schwartzia sp.]|nr:hypothetical protein [Schwartzia sp. (in: firmicutes)]
MNLAEAEGYEMTKAEAEAYLAELADFELDNEMLENAVGGIFECHMRHNCGYIGDDWK